MRLPTLVELSDGLTDKESRHGYLSRFYEAALAPRRDEPLELLEIGVAAGGSLILWHRFFRRATRIVGLDVDGRTPLLDRYRAAWGDHAANITVHCLDAYAAPATDLGSFDLLVDDGPHDLETHLALLTHYLPRLRPGGLLVIEDVRELEWKAHYAERIASLPGLTSRTLDLRAPGGPSDDVLFVVGRPNA